MDAKAISRDAYLQGMRRNHHSGEADVIVTRDKEPISHAEREIYALYDAIVECRRDDAIDRLRELCPHYQFRSAKEQRNLFPDRIPA